MEVIRSARVGGRALEQAYRAVVLVRLNYLPLHQLQRGINELLKLWQRERLLLCMLIRGPACRMTMDAWRCPRGSTIVSSTYL